MAPVIEGNDFLAFEGEIVARLKDALADVKPAVHVLTASELSDLKEDSQPTPAVHVVWNGFRVLENRTDARQSRLEHTWLVVTAVRNVRGLKNGSAVRADAGRLMARAGAAVMGLRPKGSSAPMRLTSSPAAGFGAGFMYLPLAFVVETHFKAS